MTGATTPAGTPALLELRNLQIDSRLDGCRRTIVSGLDLTVAPGETVGIVGESGSGKSVTARAVAGLLPLGLEAHGSVRYDGQELLGLPERAISRLRGPELALLFQDPFTMLNPLLRCGRQLTETIRDARGRPLGRRARRQEAVRRLAEVGIRDPDVADRYPFQLSGGMRQRVGLAAALARDPRILLADEPTTALDVTTQREILTLLRTIQASREMGLVLITHDLRVAFAVCDRVYVLYAGSLLEVAGAARLEEEPLHPYTLGLLLSEPTVAQRLPRLAAIPGAVASFDEVAGCCPFSPRCRWVHDACTHARPPLADVGDGRRSACVRVGEIRPEMQAARRAARESAAPAVAAGGAGGLVRVEGLVKVFPGAARGGRHAPDVHALKGVSIQIGEGASVGLVGESGSGKTTLARCLVGLETPTGGEITVDGVRADDFAAMPAADLRRVRRTVQMVFQDPYSSLNPVHTVGQTLREALAVTRGRGRDLDARARELLTTVGLPTTHADRKPVALSGGERQRVAIARALAVEPKLLICDEPVSALDVSVQAQILNLFQELRAELGISYLFITHDLAVVRQVVEEAYVLYKGAVVEAGAVDDVLDRPQHPYTAKLVESVPRAEQAWLGAAATVGPAEKEASG